MTWGRLPSFRLSKEICLLAAAFLSSTLSASPGPAWNLEVQKKILGNGLTVILEKDDASPTTFLQILIRGGERAEPPGKEGLAFLTTRLAVEIPDTDKVQKLMSLASRFSVASRGDYALINVECLSTNVDETLKVLSKIFLDPLFSGLRIDAVKRHMEHQGRMEQNDSVMVGHLANLQAFFGPRGYGGSVYGDETSLEAIKGGDIKDFYGLYFTAQNMIISGSSDLAADEILQLVDKYFAAVPPGKPASFEPAVVLSPPEKNAYIERDTKQSFVSLAYPLPGITPRSYALFYLVENLLGKGPGSRLWPLRAEEKLAYNVNCRVTQMQEGGILEAYLETENAKTDLALAGLEKKLAVLSAQGITAEELQLTRTAAKANFLRDNEFKAMRAATLGSFEALGLGTGYFNEFVSLLDALTVEEVNAVLKNDLDPGKGFEVVVGPKPQAR
jgi:zinc protease